ncbi:Glutamate 5-kinase [ANME-1 cluster archaeon GoMg1]|nr:Glutamate 5-kinase [ANME-1 cluster archaeon GoMg1]
MAGVRDISKAKRIVIKVGTSNLTDKSYRLDPRKVEKLAKEIIELKNQGKEVIVVTSGAIGAGIGKLDLKQRPRDIKVLQATAAVGQNILMSTYDKYFAKYEQTIAQLLLTHDNFFNRQRYLNLRNTLITLLKSGVIPIINENDTVAVDEIKLGDNDNLSALVASSLGADLLVILTDTDGLFTYDPKRSKKAEFISVVETITPEIERIASAGGKTGVGGMKTKIQAAKVTMRAGIPMVIANGNEENALARVIAGERIGTIFLPGAGAKEKMNDRKHWLRFASLVKGRIKVDEGAKNALIKSGRSLLASGVIGVEEDFVSGDPVSIVDAEGVEFAKGITNYSAEEIKKIKGAQSKEIEQILGRKEYDAVVYRGNLVLV